CAVRAHASLVLLVFFFLNDPATTEIYTLSLHDALPIYGAPAHRDFAQQIVQQRGGVLVQPCVRLVEQQHRRVGQDRPRDRQPLQDRKSTRLNSSHVKISYAVFCLKKKKKHKTNKTTPHE